MSGHQQTIYTIHESQLNSQSGPLNGQRASQSDLLIDTSGIPLTQQPAPPMQHAHLQPTQLEPATVTSQPGGASSRVAPEDQNVTYSVHPAFSVLERQSALLVRQRAEPTATCCGFESSNSYTVRAKDGSPVLKAVENSNCCERCCFGSNREYNVQLLHGDEVVARFRKPFRVSRFCCYSNAVRIESPEDNPIGSVRQLFTLFGHPRFAIYDLQQPPRSPSFLLEPSSCRFCCTPLLCTCLCANSHFRVLSAETREQVASITRSWDAGPPEEEQAAEGAPGGWPASARDQLFGVEFEANLEARHKLLLLSACFMMDFFYFERDRKRWKLTRC